MIWFTSDEHYGHANIIKFSKRPFDNVDHMREMLIQYHNELVGPEDFTWHLGDMFWNNVTVKEAQNIVTRLNGQHGIVWGNHDKVAKQIAGMFEVTEDVRMVDNVNPNVWISHYAHRAWPRSHKGAYHLFGHTHAVMPDYRYSHDAGVDANNYRPISFKFVDMMMKAKGVLPMDEVQRDMVQNPWIKEE